MENNINNKYNLVAESVSCGSSALSLAFIFGSASYGSLTPLEFAAVCGTAAFVLDVGLRLSSAIHARGRQPD